MKYLVVFSTVPPSSASRLAKHLVSSRVAACVNIVPGLTSFFHWQGKLDRAKESLLIIKTTGKALPALMREIKKRHPYECPEIVALPIVSGIKSYLDWIQSSVAGKKKGN